MNMHDIIVNNLDALNDAHQEQKSKFFDRGLPFYTCIDAAKDIWKKETGDGKTIMVIKKYDFIKKMTIDTPLK